MEKHKIILIGGDHYNGLALVRMFGKKGIKPYGIIVGENADRGFLKTSRYWNQVWTVETDEEILGILTDQFSGEEAKPAIIPWSDGAASVIDRHLEMLAPKFLVPSIGGKAGKVNQLMDKGMQVRFAHECGLDIAQSWVIDLETEASLEEITFPCIAKPVISCKGDKKDIRKIDTSENLTRYLDGIRKKGYREILIQEYISIDAEYDIEGFIHEGRYAYFVNEKVRTWPKVGGPTCYAFSVNNPELDREMDKIIEQLKKLHYSGLFDIEVFRVGERFLFNEINWRNSAVCFAAAASGVDYPFYWYQAVTGNDFTVNQPEKYGIFAMNEILDYRHVKCGDIRLGEWIKQLTGSRAKAYYDKSDILPLYKRFLLFICRRWKNE